LLVDFKSASHRAHALNVFFERVYFFIALRRL